MAQGTFLLVRILLGLAVAVAYSGAEASGAIQGIGDWVYWEKQLVAVYNGSEADMERMAVKMDVYQGKVAKAMNDTHGGSTRKFSVMVDALIAKYRESYGGAALPNAETIFPRCFPADRAAAA